RRARDAPRRRHRSSRERPRSPRAHHAARRRAPRALIYTPSLDPKKEAVAEVTLEIGREELLPRPVPVVPHALELGDALGGVVDRVAGAVVVVTRLTDRADADDVLVLLPDRELLRDHLVDVVLRQRERLAQVAVADEGHCGQRVPQLEAARRLLDR